MGGSASAPRTLSVDSPAGGVQVSETALRRVASTATADADANPRPPQPPRPPEYHPKQNYAEEEQYWETRIEALKRTHHTIDKKMSEEYDKAVTETAQMFKRAETASVVGKLPPCLDEKSAVIKCFTENPRQTLLCMNIVNTFNECVSNKRTENTPTGA